MTNLKMTFSQPAVAPRAPSRRVQRIAANLVGRDFIVGDIHGAYNSVLAAMRLANFDERVDRIFAIGDLIDRGLDSFRCAKFLRMAYVKAVAGNHEDMLLQLYSQGEPHPSLLAWAAKRNGFDWWLKVDREERQVILAAIAELPTIIELETSRGLVGLVHAEVPRGMNWQTFVEAVEDENPQVIETALWGRDRVKANDNSGVQGIDRVFVGHSIQWNGMRKLGNVYYIDTGGIFAETGTKEGARLSFVEASTRTTILAAPPPARIIDVREDWDAKSTEPFGKYAA